MAKVYQCACCSSDVTAPYFFEGKVYGYTCIKKVAPAAKRTKAVYDLADDVRKHQTRHNMAIVTLNGKKRAVRAMFSGEVIKSPYLMQTNQGIFVMVKDAKGNEVF